MRIIYFLLFLLTFSLSSCKEEKQRPVFVDISEEWNEDSLPNNDTSIVQANESISVPFREENGVKFVNVRVNGVEFEMIFDTGCSVTLISVAEANYLYQKGKLQKNDIIGMAQLMIADGSIVENMVVNLKNIVIADKITCRDVKAVVSDNVAAPLLLGNDVLDRLAAITIDNQNKTLHFQLKQTYE